MAPSFGLASISERVRRTSIRQGLLGGNRFWLVVFGLSHLGRWSGKLTKKERCRSRSPNDSGPGRPSKSGTSKLRSGEGGGRESRSAQPDP